MCARVCVCLLVSWFAMLITVWCLYIAARSIARESKYKLWLSLSRESQGKGVSVSSSAAGDSAVDDTLYVFWVSVSYKLVASGSAGDLDLGSREVCFKAICLTLACPSSQDRPMF